jgi:glycosyltransferase involved in cell wall biosynthesis
MFENVRCHGVLITFRRHDALVDHLRILADQTRPLTTLLVVDNDDDPVIRALVEDPDGPGAEAAATVAYLGLAGNPGPAGGIAAGIDRVLADQPDDDWLVLLDDDDPPPRPDTLAALLAVLEELCRSHERVGGVGLWGAALRRTGRLRAATANTPEVVAYLPGGACPHYSIAALRASGGPDPALFFGFDDLDLGLALHRAGWELWSSGFARDHGWAAMVDDRGVSAAVESPTWRRYYSLRNLIVVLRRDGRGVAAAAMSIVAGLAKPILNLPRRPRTAWANLRLNTTALRDGWGGRLGKTLDPQTDSGSVS